MAFDGSHQPRDLIVTGAMLQSNLRPPNLLTELSELREMTKMLADDPLAALRYLVGVVRQLCGAGSSGVSLLRHDAEGQEIVCWEVVSGALATHEGTGMRKNSSPCGLCLKAGATILVSQPERAYSDLRDIQPPMIEDLVFPLYDNARKPLGTLWVAHHDHTSHFGSDDARIVEQLAAQAVLAIRLMERATERRSAVSMLESYHGVWQDLFSRDLYQERSRREHAEEAAGEIRRALALRESAIQEAHHRVKNTLQVAASVLSLHAHATDSEQVRLTLQESHRRLQLLAKAHELLYTSASSMPTIFMPALLDTLSNALRHSFTSPRVKLQIMVEPLTLPADEAIALALLTNEVVTNAYKHAFPDDSRGGITVTLKLAPDNMLSLRVADDGIGLNAASIAEGVGLKLIRGFAAQLGGALTIAADADPPGTVISLAMRLPSGLGRRCIDSSLDSAAGKPS